MLLSLKYNFGVNEIRKTKYKSGQFYHVLEINLGNVARLHDFQETLLELYTEYS